MSDRADLLVVNGDVVTMDPQRRILVGGAVAIAGERIVAVGATSGLRAQFPGTEEIDARRGVVTPGLINAHQHITGDPLARSCTPDDLEAGRSIFEWSVPLHAAHTPDDDEMSATLCSLESVQNGVTTVVEAGTVAFPDRVAAGMQAVGTRGTRIPLAAATWRVHAPAASTTIGTRMVPLLVSTPVTWPLSIRTRVTAV